MSRYVYTNQVGIGNYGGLASAWGFGDGKEKGRKRKHPPKGKKRGHHKGTRKGPPGQRRRQEVKPKFRDLPKEKKLHRLEKRIEKRTEAGKTPIPPKMAERIATLPPEAQEALRARFPFFRPSVDVAPPLVDVAPPPAEVPPTAPGALPMAPVVGMPMPMMPMMRGQPRPTFVPRGPVKPPVITPQQARMGTLAAALAASMLFF